MPQTLKHSPVVFFDPDSPEAGEALAELLKSLPPERQVLGLIVKFVTNESGEQIVNWEYADARLLKAMTLVLPDQNPDKE